MMPPHQPAAEKQECWNCQMDLASVAEGETRCSRCHMPLNPPAHWRKLGKTNLQMAAFRAVYKTRPACPHEVMADGTCLGYCRDKWSDL